MVTNHYIIERPIDDMTNEKRAWHIIGLFAGFANEKISYNFNEFEKYELGTETEKHDFCWVKEVLELAFQLRLPSPYDSEGCRAYDKKEADIKIDIKVAADNLWTYTLKIFKDPIVRQAVDFATREIERQQTLSKLEIKILVDQIFEIPGVEEYRIQVPVDYLPHKK